MMKHCLLLLPLFVLVWYLFFFVMKYLVFFMFCNHLFEKKRAGYFTLFVLFSHMDASVLCLSSWWLGLVCSKCGISWSYSLTLDCREDLLNFVYFWMNTL